MELSITFQFPHHVADIVNSQIADIVTDIDGHIQACEVNLLIDTEAKELLFRTVIKELVIQQLRNSQMFATLASV